MGFMDKAKKLAEQAQQKLDEAQKQFGQGDSPGAESQPGGVRYDEHGRPIGQAPPAGDAPPPPAGDAPPPAGDAPPPPAGAAPPPSAQPAAPAADASAGEDRAPAGEQAPPPRASGGDANATPDPFKPIQQ
jgi:hypothetical protein